MLGGLRVTMISIAAAGVVALGAGGALAVPVHSSNTDVTSWDVGSGQVNGNFSVTSDLDFAGGPLELGLRAEQRQTGAVVPTAGDNYLVQPGIQPGVPTRAWWNFQLSIAYEDISLLDSLTLTISLDDGTNSQPSGTGIFDLLPLRAFIDDRNANGDLNFADIYQVSQNPVFFPWFTPAYDLSADSSFAYSFTLTATLRDSSLSASMCVHTEGLSCSSAEVPEPGTIGLLGAGLAALGVAIRRRKTA